MDRVGGKEGKPPFGWSGVCFLESFKKKKNKGIETGEINKIK